MTKAPKTTKACKGNKALKTDGSPESTEALEATSRDFETEMYNIYIERGSQTEKDLIGLGYTAEQVKTYAPRVAARLLQMAA